MSPQEELALRRQQLDARTNPDGRNVYGYRANVAALKQRIAELEAQIGPV